MDEGIKFLSLMLIDHIVDDLFKARRQGVLRDLYTEEEIDKYIVEKSRESQAKWDGTSKSEMLMIMLGEIAAKHKKESTEDDELSQ